ncbi:MAG: gamma-glutamyltransferase [Anaerolineales bacterium]
MNILEGFDLASLESLSVEKMHLMIEAMRLAFADASWYVSDPKFSNIPVNELLSKDYASERRKLINTQSAIRISNAASPSHPPTPSTSASRDKFGNACSFINSNYMGSGTGIVPKGWGFSPART